MKKTVSLLLCLVLLLNVLSGAVFAVDEPTIRVETANSARGETVNLSVQLENNPGIITAEFSVQYDDEQLTLTSVQAGGYGGSFDWSAGYPVTWYSSTPNVDTTTNGTIAVLTFTVADNATFGEHTVTITYVPDAIYNADEDNISFTVASGGVKVVAPPHDHTWNDGVVTKDPTCTEKGEALFTCTFCGETETRDVDPLGHSFTNYVSNNNATCAADGTKTATCDRDGCNVTDTITDTDSHLSVDHTSDGETDCSKASYCTVCHAELRAAGEHTWDEGVEQTPPTCEAKGSALFTCTVCGEKETRDVAALGHDYQVESVKAPTCTEGGYTHYVCSHDASHTYDGNFTTALGHDLQYAASGNALTETCSRCDHNEWGAVTVEFPTYTFTGEAITPATFSHSTGWLGGELAPQYIDDNVNVGTATAAIAANEVTALITFDITKAAAPTLTAEAVQTLLCSDIVTGEKVYTFALNSVIAGIPTNAGEASFKATDGTYGTSAVDGATLTYTVPAAQAAGTTDAITVSVASQNYETANVTVNFEFKNKIGVSDKLSLYKVEEVVVGGGQYDFLVLEPVVLYDGTVNEEIMNATTIVYTDAFGKQYTELTAKTPAGTYTFVATYEDSIPEGEIPGHIGTISGELEITKGWPQLGIFGSPDKEYDGTAATITEDDGDEVIEGCEYYYGGESVPVITWYAVDGEGAKTKLDAAPVNVGTYNVEVSLAESDNYQASSIDVDFEITPRPATITVADATKEYGTEDPAFTGTVEGLIDAADLGTITYVRTAADAEKENYGTVELTAKYTENANYTVEVVNGKLTITKTQPTLAQVTKFDGIKKTYDNVAVVAELTAAEGVEGLGKITVKYQLGEAAATTTAPVNAGVYAVIASIAEGTNYAAKDLTVGEIKIYKAERSFVNLPEGVVYADPAADLALQLAEGADLDKSAKVIYTSYGPATVNGTGKITAIGNGKAKVTVAIAETDNYLPFEEVSVYVYAVTDPVLGVSAGKLAATLDGGKIVLNGLASEGSIADVVLELEDGYTQELADKTITVKRGEDVIATYEIDDSALVNLSVAIFEECNKSLTSNVVEVGGLLNGTAAAAKEQVDAVDEGKTVEKVTVQMVVENEGQDEENKNIYSLDLTPQIILTVDGEDQAPVEVSELDAPVETKVDITNLKNAKGGIFLPIYVRTSHKANETEILPVGIVMEDLGIEGEKRFALFYSQRFSTFELIDDDSEITITFVKNDTSVQVMTFNAFDANSGVAFPTDAKSGYTFKGWKFEGVEGIYTNLSADLMAQLGAAATATPEFRVNSSSAGGASTKTSTLSVAEAKNGTVSVNANNATEGATITVTAKPDAGYKVAAVKVTTKSGKAVEVKEDNGIYTFTMPGEDATVSAEFVEGDATQVFEDVAPNAYYAKAVEWAVEKGITTGTTATTFSPNASCTRAQMVTFLWRAAGAPETEVSTAFKDIKGDAYYAQAVAWALDNGITNGKGKGLFDPDGTVTRAESITMLFRYAKGVAGANMKSGFTDVDAYAYYFNAVDWAVNNGITNGTTATTFSPNADCVRAQIVTFLFRLLGDK